MKIYVNQAAGRGEGCVYPGNALSLDRDDAARIARPGDEVIVAPGIYRESVDPIFAGEADARIVYRSQEPLGALITGAEEIKSSGTLPGQYLGLPGGQRRVRWVESLYHHRRRGLVFCAPGAAYRRGLSERPAAV